MRNKGFGRAKYEFYVNKFTIGAKALMFDMRQSAPLLGSNDRGMGVRAAIVITFHSVHLQLYLDTGFRPDPSNLLQ